MARSIEEQKKLIDDIVDYGSAEDRAKLDVLLRIKGDEGLPKEVKDYIRARTGKVIRDGHRYDARAYDRKRR